MVCPEVLFDGYDSTNGEKNLNTGEMTIAGAGASINELTAFAGLQWGHQVTCSIDQSFLVQPRPLTFFVPLDQRSCLVPLILGIVILIVIWEICGTKNVIIPARLITELRTLGLISSLY